MAYVPPVHRPRRVQPAFPDGQCPLADIVPGQPAQRREVREPADVDEPHVEPQGGIELAAHGPGRSPQQPILRRPDVEGGAAGDDRQAARGAFVLLPGCGQGAEEGQEMGDGLHTQGIAAGFAGRPAEVAEEIDRAQRRHLLLRLAGPQPADASRRESEPPGVPGGLISPQVTEGPLTGDHPARAGEIGGSIVEQPGRRRPRRAVWSGAHLRPARSRVYEPGTGVPDQDQSTWKQQSPEEDPRGGGERGRPGVDDDEIAGTCAKRAAAEINGVRTGQIRRREARGRADLPERLGQPPGLLGRRPEQPELRRAAVRRTAQIVGHRGLPGVRGLGELRDAVRARGAGRRLPFQRADQPGQVEAIVG